MKILNVTEQYVFVGCSEKEKNIPCFPRETIFINQEVFDFVSKWLEPRKEFFIAKLNNFPTQTTCEYFEENWHDKLVSDIVKEIGCKDNDISNSISAYFGY